jgi:hypothetical protein
VSTAKWGRFVKFFNEKGTQYESEENAVAGAVAFLYVKCVSYAAST